jgi:hypothetical protein
MTREQWWRAVRMGAFIIGMAGWAWYELESCTGYTDGELLACQGVEWWQGLETRRVGDEGSLAECERWANVFSGLEGGR